MKKSYRVLNLCCANCGRKIEEGIKKIPGVTDAKLLFMTQKLILETVAEDQTEILGEVRKIAKKIESDCEIVA